MRTVFFNGQFIPEGEAKVSIFDRGYLFADAVYEVVSVLDRKLIDFAGHMGRLARSLAEMSMPPTYHDEQWLELLRALIDRNNLNEGLIYLQISRGNPGDRSFYWPSAETAPTILAFTQNMALLDNPAASAGLSVVTLPDLRWGRADIKTTQLLYASMMKMEAKAAGADDAWLERDGLITEGTSQNAHIVNSEGVLLSHQLDRNILHGITRAAMLSLAGGMNIRYEQRAFTVAEAETAREAFVTSASTFVMPVTSINGKAIGGGKPGPVAGELRRAYIDWAMDNAV
ncbi:aminotransferase class IV [Sphingorhabdus arenilitoris]|uniref:Probable branched-chain-amino-acid aminotransferase n=1 Tax=Sphingorhabdus arenilitoris TaxID=1490041 RepID=A0ABV8RHV2_9SPHN